MRRRLAQKSTLRAGWSGVLHLLGLALLVACDAPSPPPRTATTEGRPAGETAGKGGEPVRRSEGPPRPAAPGVLVGRVVYLGPLPESTKMYIPEAGNLEAHTVIVDGATRGLKNAAVWVEGAGRRVPGSRLEPAVMDQRDWAFVPHVFAVRPGQSVRFVNSDDANHNVHSRSPGYEFNLGTPAGQGSSHRFRKPTGANPVRINCDIHPWMRAWIYVFERDAFAITDARGSFQIEGIPPGTWTVHAHHADASLSASVEARVAEGSETELRIELRSDTLPEIHE